jgi:hypothetical protein
VCKLNSLLTACCHPLALLCGVGKERIDSSLLCLTRRIKTHRVKKKGVVDQQQQAQE